MRIIAGDLGGRSFASPRGHKTHPMSDKLRGALFNTLGDISGLTVLDTFAGSGALSFEALSRGAASATAIDDSRPAQQAIQSGITSLGLVGKAKLIRASAGAWLSTSEQHFDIVLCDPPYDKIQPVLLERLAVRAKRGGVIVFSLPPDSSFGLPEEYELLSEKKYGDAALFFYRRIT